MSGYAFYTLAKYPRDGILLLPDGKPVIAFFRTPEEMRATAQAARSKVDAA